MSKTEGLYWKTVIIPPRQTYTIHDDEYKRRDSVFACLENCRFPKEGGIFRENIVKKA